MSDRELELDSDEDRLNDTEIEDINEPESTDEESSEVPEQNEEPAEQNDEETAQAKKFGHLSKEDWIAQGRDPKLYKTPEEFNKTAQVIDQLYSLKKKVDQRDKEIEALVAYQQRTAQREYERAKQELERQLDSSKNDMDMDGVAHYTKELVRLQDAEELSTVQHKARAQQDAQAAFIERNQHWFNDRNPDLKNRAIEIDNEIKELYPNASYDELAQKIEARMQYEHPERVLGQRTAARPNTSQSSVNKTAVVKTHGFKSLSQEHRDTYNVYKRINPKTTEAEFIARLKADGEI